MPKTFRVSILPRTYRAVFVIDNFDAIILRVRGLGQPALKEDEI